MMNKYTESIAACERTCGLVRTERGIEEQYCLR